LKDFINSGGHHHIYSDLLARLSSADIALSSHHLGLTLNADAEAEIPFLRSKYLILRQGVRRSDGKKVPDAIGSVMIHYILNGSPARPCGQFVTLAELAGPLFKHSSYSAGALEAPIVKRFQGRVPELLAIAESVGGHLGGEAGLGAVSLILEMLPHIPLQLIFYDRDEEFPARATLLYDANAIKMIEFEVLAVLATVFVQSLIKLHNYRGIT
jgi:hypothetical protein